MDSENDKQGAKQSDQWETLHITAAIEESHYGYWRTHEAFTDVLANGGRRQKRLVPRSIGAVTAVTAVAGGEPVAGDGKNQQRNKFKRQIKLPSSSKVSDPP